MPLPIAHGLLGAGIIAAAHPQANRRYILPFISGALLANLADADFLLVLIFHSRAWHRGFSHSIVFAFLVFLAIFVSLGWQQIKVAVAYGLAFASHAILDYVTTREGGGVELFWPFSSARLGLGWIGLSELPSRLPALGIVKALIVEFLLFTPVLVLTICARKIISNRIGMAEDAK